MRCENCGREINNVWGFCPNCGSFSGGLEDSFMNIAKIFGGKAVVKQEGDSFIVVLEIQGRRQAFKITPLDMEELPYASAESESEPKKPQKMRRFERTQELKAETNYVGDSLYIRARITGISEEDVEIDKMENSIELRAYKGNTRFFKLIPIPDNYKVVSKEILPEELFITLKKK